jgi:hypothetical protein
MTIKIISGKIYEVDSATTTEAWELFSRFDAGTTTSEENSLITDTGLTTFEIRAEGEAEV